LSQRSEIKAYLHAAQLWVEKSYASYNFRPVGFANLPLAGIATGNRKQNGSQISFVNFARRQEALYFCNRTETLVKIHPDGSTSENPYKSWTMKDMITLESPHIRTSSNHNALVAVDQPSLDDLCQIYIQWLKTP
jgi:hypothetical protein